MFLVQDTRKERTTKIQALASEDLGVAVIIASADFEWTCRRCILALGTSPTKSIREATLHKCTGLDKYKDAWKKEVFPRFGVKLPELITDWAYFKKSAFVLRHKLVHGVSGTTGLSYGTNALNSILAASVALTAFAETKNCTIYGRQIRRYKQHV